MLLEKTKVVGVTYDGRQENIKKINPMVHPLVAVREPNNPYDENAIHIYYIKTDDFDNKELVSCGYINRHLAAKLAPLMDGDRELKIHSYHIMGSGVKTPLGIMIEYSIE